MRRVTVTSQHNNNSDDDPQRERKRITTSIHPTPKPTRHEWCWWDMQIRLAPYGAAGAERQPCAQRGLYGPNFCCSFLSYVYFMWRLFNAHEGLNFRVEEEDNLNRISLIHFSLAEIIQKSSVQGESRVTRVAWVCCRIKESIGVNGLGWGWF